MILFLDIVFRDWTKESFLNAILLISLYTDIKFQQKTKKNIFKALLISKTNKKVNFVPLVDYLNQIYLYKYKYFKCLFLLLLPLFFYVILLNYFEINRKILI